MMLASESGHGAKARLSDRLRRLRKIVSGRYGHTAWAGMSEGREAYVAAAYSRGYDALTKCRIEKR